MPSQGTIINLSSVETQSYTSPIHAFSKLKSPYLAFAHISPSSLSRDLCLLDNVQKIGYTFLKAI